jgi:hypothetical protein
VNGANEHELASWTTLRARVSSCHPHVSAYCSVTFLMGAAFLLQSTSVRTSFLKVFVFADRQNKTPTTVPNVCRKIWCLSFCLITSQSAVSGGLYGTFGTQGFPDIRMLFLMYLCVNNIMDKPNYCYGISSCIPSPYFIFLFFHHCLRKMAYM